MTLASPGLGHRASLDPVRHKVRPMFSEDNIKLMFDSSASTNMIKKGDNIYINYSIRLEQDFTTITHRYVFAR